MAKIIDIILTGIDDNNKNPFQNQIIVKVKQGSKFKNYISGYLGFYYYEDELSSEHIEQCIDDAGSISLIKGTDKMYSVYKIDDDYYVILKNQYICLKTEQKDGEKKIIGAYCMDPNAKDDEDAYRSYPDITKFELAEAVVKDFTKSYPEIKSKIISDKKNNAENSNDDKIENE